MTPRLRTPVVGVMGGSKASPEVQEMAYDLGGLVARRGWVLLNGGRNVGVMKESARGAYEAGGTVIGVLPDTTAAHASPHLTYAIMTGMGDGRNLLNVLSSDVVFVCPGRMGTMSELAHALNHHKPVVCLRFDPGELFDPYRRRGLLFDAETPEEAVNLAAEVLARKNL